MKKSLVLFSFLICILSANSQSESNKVKYELGFLDSYVIKIRIDSSIVKKRDYCIYKKGTICNLYRVKILSIVYYSPNSYLDSLYLKNTKYILVPEKFEDSLLMNNEYLVTVFGTPSKLYLGFNKIIYVHESSNYE